MRTSSQFASSKKDKLKDEGAAHYKGADGVVVVVDPTRDWTFSFARDLVEQMPEGMEVLVVANYRDKMESWLSSRETMQKFVAGCGDHVHYCETCLRLPECSCICPQGLNPKPSIPNPRP